MTPNPRVDGRFRLVLLALLVGLASCGGHAVAATVLVVCDDQLRPALDQWAAVRREQGHDLRFLAPVRSAGGTRARLASAFAVAPQSSEQPIVLLVGDGGAIGPAPFVVPAEVVSDWGPEAAIVSDSPYADFDGDGVDEAMAVARLPFSEPRSLRRYADRVVSRIANGSTRTADALRINAGVGGFSQTIDAAIEVAARSVVTRFAPDWARVSLQRWPTEAAESSRPTTSGGGVWAWLGHGLRDRLPGLRDNDLIASAQGADVALLLACYSGDFTCAAPTVAEKLLAASEGPLAVIASTGVSMPYGNARLGAEMLVAWRDSANTPIGEVYGAARRSLIGRPAEDSLGQLDALATLVGADRATLPAESRDHRLLYQLLGDPLTELPSYEPLVADIHAMDSDPTVVTVRAIAPLDGRLIAEASPVTPIGAAPLVTDRIDAKKGETVTLTLPIGSTTSARRVRVRVTLIGRHERHAAIAKVPLR